MTNEPNSAVILTAEIPEQDLGAFSRPADKSRKSFIADRAKGDLAEIAKTESFQKWKTFEDDNAGFG